MAKKITDLTALATAEADDYFAVYEDSSGITKKIKMSALSTYVETALGLGVTVPRQTIVEIGDWDMTASSTINVAHGLTLSKIRRITVLIRDDSATGSFPLDFTSSGATNGAYYANGTNVVLSRVTSGYFDNISFNATSYNRGWIVLEYID